MDRSYSGSWEETVFEHRNKAYGAYCLRFTYPYALTASALIVILLFLAAMTGLRFFTNKKEQRREIPKVHIINYSELSAPPPIEKIFIPPEPEPEKEVIVQKVKVEKYVAPVIVQEEVSAPEEEMMTMEEVKKDLASTDNTIEASDGDELPTAIPVTRQVVVSDVSRSPEFPGGKEALTAWLQSHLKYPAAAKRMGIEGKVVVAFLVNENGKISDTAVVESLHRLCDREAMRLVKAMPDWIPGERNGSKSSVECAISVLFDLQTAT